MSAEVAALGEILEWPGGYAMTLGVAKFGQGVVRCCSGHETSEAAKDHGVARAVEMALKAAERDVAAWAERARAEGTADA